MEEEWTHFKEVERSESRRTAIEWEKETSEEGERESDESILDERRGVRRSNRCEGKLREGERG